MSFEVKNEKDAIGYFEGVLVYTKLLEPQLKYKELVASEYSTGLIVPKAAAKAYKKVFKGAVKELDAEEFAEKYNFERPFPEEDEVFILKFAKGAVDKTGKAFDAKFRPKLLINTAEGKVDVTTTKKVANGVKALVSYRCNINDFGTFAELRNILVQEDDFVEYVGGAGEAGSEFDTVAKPASTPAKAPAAKAKAAPKRPPLADNTDEDEDSPFN